LERRGHGDELRAFANDLETFKLGFRIPLSIKLMYVGCKLAFSANDSWDNSFANLCLLRTSAKASDISKRRIYLFCGEAARANTDNSLCLTFDLGMLKIGIEVENAAWICN
jgi:hypothetical protein